MLGASEFGKGRKRWDLRKGNPAKSDSRGVEPAQAGEHVKLQGGSGQKGRHKGQRGKGIVLGQLALSEGETNRSYLNTQSVLLNTWTGESDVLNK